MENIWVSAYAYDHYLWENGDLKREPVEEDAREAARVHSKGNVFRTYARRFHDPRDVQRLVEEVAAAWVKDVGKQYMPTSLKVKTNWVKNWSRKEKEAKRIYIATFTQEYNRLVRENDAADEAARRREEAARRQAEQEAEARRRAEQTRAQQPKPVYTPPPPQPKPQPPQPVQQPAPQPKPEQQPQHHRPATPPNVASKEGATITLKRVDHSNPDECVYVLEVRDPKYMDRPYEQEWVVPLVEDTTTPTTSSYGSSGTNERGLAGAGGYAQAGYEIPRPQSTSGTPQRPRKPQGGYFRKP